MIWDTKVYDKMYDLTIREKIFFFLCLECNLER